MFPQVPTLWVTKQGLGLKKLWGIRCLLIGAFALRPVKMNAYGVGFTPCGSGSWTACCNSSSPIHRAPPPQPQSLQEHMFQSLGSYCAAHMYIH